MLFGQLDRWLAPAPDPERVGWLGDWSYAHRGLHGRGVPENSPAAFTGAMVRGLGIECDIQRSQDGVAMVFHDATLDRLTAESGPVARRTAAELGRITLTGGEDCIPTLRQVLDQVKGRVPLLIEIKSRVETRTVALCTPVRRALEGYLGPHAVMSFDPQVVRWFAEHSPLTLRGLVVTEERAKALPGRLRRRLAFWYARPQFLAYDIRDLPSRFPADQRQRGIPVLTWTVREADHIERAARYADAPIAEGTGIA